MTARSALIDGLLTEVGTPFGVRATEHPCEGSKFHSPSPLTTQPVLVGGVEVYLCPTCSAKLSIYIYLATTVPDRLSWPVQRDFGNAIRALGNRQMASWKRGGHD